MYLHWIIFLAMWSPSFLYDLQVYEEKPHLRTITRVTTTQLRPRNYFFSFLAFPQLMSMTMAKLLLDRNCFEGNRQHGWAKEGIKKKKKESSFAMCHKRVPCSQAINLLWKKAEAGSSRALRLESSFLLINFQIFFFTFFF